MEFLLSEHEIHNFPKNIHLIEEKITNKDYQPAKKALSYRFRGNFLWQENEITKILAWQRNFVVRGKLRINLYTILNLEINDGVVTKAHLGDCKGSQGSRCRYDLLQTVLDEKLVGETLLSSQVLKNFTDLQCHHISEVVQAAAGFFDECQKRNLSYQSEQEVLEIIADSNGVALANRQEVFGKKTDFAYGLSDDTALNEKGATEIFRALASEHRRRIKAWNLSNKYDYSTLKAGSALTMLALYAQKHRHNPFCVALIQRRLKQLQGDKCIGFQK